MNCRTARVKLSAFEEGLLPDAVRNEVAQHLRRCRACNNDCEQLHHARVAVRHLPAYAAPPALTVNLRIAASKELQRRANTLTRWDRLSLTLRDLMRPVALPLAGGILSALLLFCALVPTFTQRYSGSDVPLSFFTEPVVKSMAPLGFMHGDAIVDVSVDEDGCAVSYSIVGGGHSEELRRTIENNLLFTRFTPATAFGIPTASTVRIAFRSSRVEVRG